MGMGSVNKVVSRVHAQQGISVVQIRQHRAYWIPVFTGMTHSCETFGKTITERPCYA